jgi:3-oxoacyl-[acyl-carrier-protein] synthase-1
MAGACFARGIIPGCLGATQIDPSFRSRVLTAPLHRAPRIVLSNAFGFGGTNCSLLLGSVA